MVQHIADLLGLIVNEVCHEFPAAQTILPINISPLCCHIQISNTLPFYPSNEFIGTTDPSYPNSPPFSPEPLPIPPPHESMTRASPFIDNHSMAVILYNKLTTQEALTKARDADTKRQTPSPTGPQPGIHLGPGWMENWMETNTHHYFVIPDSNEDIIAPFICYDMSGPFPELLATNGRNCTIQSCPLHARADIQGHTPLSPHDELLFIDELLYSSTINYTLKQEENPTLIGEVKHFCSYHSKATKLAQEMGCIQEALETERQALYHSLDCLAATNTPQRVLRHIGRNLWYSPYFSS